MQTSFDRARAAIGSIAHHHVLELSGRAQFSGAPARFRWAVAADGRFSRAVEGPLVERIAFDGKNAWQADGDGPVYQLELFAREAAQIESWTLGALWSGPDGPVDVEACGEGVLAARVRHGRLRATMPLDQDRALPSGVAYKSFSGDCGLRFEDWRAVGSLRVPFRISSRTPVGIDNRFDVENAAVRELRPEDSFHRPPRAERDERFRTDRRPSVLLRRAESGHLFVKPLFDGAQLGWFAFDTGAGVSLISTSAARAVSMVELGQATVVGAGENATPARLVRGGKFELGPLEIRRLAWTESDALAGMSELLGEPVDGVIGWDVLARAVVELDFEGGELCIHDPASYRLAAGAWEELVLHRRHPFVKARFEGEREGLFCIDSGAGATTVMFHRPTIEALNLLQDREPEDATAYGAGGALALKVGAISWFEVAGRRTADVPAIFCLDEKGALADEWTAGNLGQALFHGLVPVFDYSRRRVAFLPKG